MNEHVSNDAHGKNERSSWHVRLLRSGELQGLRSSSARGDDVYLANPEQSIVAHRECSAGFWEITRDENRGSGGEYKRAVDAIDRAEFLTEEAAILVSLAKELADVHHEDVTVTDLRQYLEGGHPRVRVRLEDRARYGHVPWRSFTMALAIDDLFAVQSYEYVLGGPEPGTIRCKVEYDHDAGIPVVRAYRSLGTWPDGRHTSMHMQVLERRFEPVPEEEFTPERLLDGPRVVKVMKRDSPSNEPLAIVACFRACLLAGAVSLISGIGTALSSPMRRRCEQRWIV
jgi:hypothetical protein